MISIPYFFITSLFISFLVSCSNNNLQLDEEVSIIEIYEFHSNTLIDTIEDKDFIDELIKQLNKAKTKSTETLDFELPEYELLFKDNQGKEIYKIAYYVEEVNLGVKGRYWNEEKELIFQVSTILPAKLPPFKTNEK